MPMSTFLRNELRKHLFRTGSYAKPTVLGVSLHTADPGATGASEVAVGAYARVQRDPLDANWGIPADGATENSAELLFPTPTANWGSITHFGIWDATTVGNFLFGAALTTAKTVNNGDPAPKFAIGARVSAPVEIIVPVGGSVRCHRCSYFCGEAGIALQLVGVVKPNWLRDLILPPRQSWRCPNCGWHNVFKPLTEEPPAV